MSNRCKGDSLTKPRKMFSPADLTAIQQEREARVNSIFTSKRPLQCPHIDCNRYVSIYDLNAHFQHEHMEIPIAETFVDARNPLSFHPREVRYGVKQCLILLNVSAPEIEDGSQVDEEENTEKSVKPAVVVAVLASRIAAAQLADESESLIGEEENGGLQLSNDKIIIWTASNIACNYSYTVAVSTVSEDIRVKYYGPVLQLVNSPKNLCMEGHCLILSHYHFLGMSENGSKPLNLDVIIHSED